MREIKFRAWHKEKKIMITGLETKPGNILHLDREVSDVELMQYIGIQDKNNTDIYEGDIIQTYHRRLNEKDFTPNKIRAVCYGERECAYKLKGLGNVGTYYAGNNYFNRIEVIGNVYENPELLK